MAKKRSKYPGEESGGRSVGRRRRRHWRNIQIRVRPLTGQEPLNHQTAHSTPHCSGHLLPHRMTTERVWLTIFDGPTQDSATGSKLAQKHHQAETFKSHTVTLFQPYHDLTENLTLRIHRRFFLSSQQIENLPLSMWRFPQWILVDIAFNGHDSGTDSLEVPTIYEAYFSGLCKGISPQNMARNMVQYLHLLESWRSPIDWLMGLPSWSSPVQAGLNTTGLSTSADRNTHPFPLEKWTSFFSKKNMLDPK